MESDDDEILDGTRPNEELPFSVEGQVVWKNHGVVHGMNPVNAPGVGRGALMTPGVIPGYGGAFPYYGGFLGAAYIPGTLPRDDALWGHGLWSSYPGILPSWFRCTS
eukprot:IDg9284t1